MADTRTLRNGRGRIRCWPDTGYWRDCGNWAVAWVWVYDYFRGEMAYWPKCEEHRDE